MNDNDGGLKRSPEPVENASTVEHKKQKISNEQQPEEVSILPTALVLDKVQEETINDLVKNSNAAVSLLQQNTGIYKPLYSYILYLTNSSKLFYRYDKYLKKT
jgi:hypothetical protein